MSNLLVVFGATGNQGGSIVDFVLNHPELSNQFYIRGTTRDISTPASQKLQSRGVEMVTCDVNDSSSVESAVNGAHTIFSVTVGDYQTNTREIELNQGKTIANAAVAAGATYLVFSTLPNVSKNSGGNYSTVWSFDVKAEIEDHIRSLPIKSAFYSPGSFMQNFHTVYKPRKQDDGSYVIPSIEDSSSKHMPLIDITDTGKYIGAILQKPDEYEGKVLYGAVGLYSWNQITEAISNATGKTVKHKVLPEAAFRGFMDPVRGQMLCDMMNNRAIYGYYGAGQEDHIRWSNEQAIGSLTTFEEWLTRNPLNL